MTTCEPRIERPRKPTIADKDIIRKCIYCGVDMPNDSCPIVFCRKCGLPQYIDRYCSGGMVGYKPTINSALHYKSCFKCGCPNHIEANYCRTCGTNIETHAIDEKEREWVDLGLSVKWSAKDLAGYYRWKDRRSYWQDYPKPYKRYNSDKIYDKVDTATVKWGEQWRMPTREEFQELIDICKWEKVTLRHGARELLNVAFKVTGPNGNYIYFYNSGVGYIELVRDLLPYDVLFRDHKDRRPGDHQSFHSFSYWTSDLVPDLIFKSEKTGCFLGIVKKNTNCKSIFEKYNSPLTEMLGKKRFNIFLSLQNVINQLTNAYAREHENYDLANTILEEYWQQITFEPGLFPHSGSDYAPCRVRPVMDK